MALKELKTSVFKYKSVKVREPHISQKEESEVMTRESKKQSFLFGVNCSFNGWHECSKDDEKLILDITDEGLHVWLKMTGWDELIVVLCCVWKS